MPRCKLCSGMTTPYTHSALVQCTICGVIAQHPLPSQPALDALYQDEFYDTKGDRFSPLAEHLIRIFRFLRANQVCRWAKKGKVIDIGFSRGHMLSALRKRGWESYGLTNSHNAFAHGKRIGLRVRFGTLDKARFPSQFFSAITMWHVLEHVRNPLVYLRQCHRILKRGGTLIIEVPNIGSPVARWSGKDWLGLDLPRHLYHFTPETLQSLLERCGFTVVNKRFFSLEHSIFSALQSMLNRLTGQRNVLFESMKKQQNVRRGERAGHAVLAVMLLPFAIAVSIGCALARNGDIMRFYAVRV